MVSLLMPKVKSKTSAPDMSVKVGDLILPNPIMSASGTVGYADELGSYLDFGQLGAVVTKSLPPFAWNGNPAPRLLPTNAGMLNSVGLQNPGVSVCHESYLPKLVATGARVVASIWGRTVDDYRVAASGLVDADVVAVEVNVSCPNLESSSEMFGCSESATAAVISGVVGALSGAEAEVPVWVKLLPNVSDIVTIARSALDAGASAVTLTNTLAAIAIDADSGLPVLGNVGGGLSGAALKPVALRAVYDVRAALGEVSIVGVGGIFSGVDVVEFLAAGASAVQVGTATFVDPRAPMKIAKGLARWCSRRSVRSVRDLVGRAHV